MPACVLPDRSVIDISGEEALHLLHNVLTCNVETLAPGEARAAALLTPQGKVMFDFLIAMKSEAHYFADIRADVADDFIRRMIMYRLRAKVEISKREESLVAVSFDDDSPEAGDSLRDTRFKDVTVMRHYAGAADAGAQTDGWDGLRIAHGVAESGKDFELGDAFAHDVGLDQIGGLDFKKGCYVGQEVVSRMQHRGTARRRVVVVTSKDGGPLPQSGTALMADGKPAGALGTVAGDRALAIARLDRLADAIHAGKALTADGTAIDIAVSAGVSYSLADFAPDEAGHG